jgi:hypothetical protein
MTDEPLQITPQDVMAMLEAQRNAAQTALAVVEAQKAALMRLVTELRARLPNGHDPDV